MKETVFVSNYARLAADQTSVENTHRLLSVELSSRMGLLERWPGKNGHGKVKECQPLDQVSSCSEAISKFNLFLLASADLDECGGQEF